MKQQRRVKMEKHLTIENENKITDIMTRLLSQNMKAGASFEKAMDQVFNRMAKDHPTVLIAWIKNNEK